MAITGTIHRWINLLLRQFGRSQNLDGDYVSIEPAAIPTVTMLANWAKTERPGICEMWVFGSAVDHARWKSLNDDLDILFIVSDKDWTPDTARNISREAPLSDQYLKTDIRVKSESECEPWLGLARRNQLVSTKPDNEKESLAENVMRHGVCVWRRDS